MNILDELMPEQRSLIEALPYRVGLWISRIDESGGDSADDMEQQALSNIIHGFAQDVFGSELVQYVMMGTLARKGEWEAWDQDLARVPEECAKAVEIVRQHASGKDVKAFSIRLMEIAEAVALAFREYGDTMGFVQKSGVYAAYFMARVRARLRGTPMRSFGQFLSVSPMERRALRRLSQVLKMPQLY